MFRTCGRIGRAIAQREDPLIIESLHRLVHQDLVAAIGLKAKLPEEFSALHTRRPDDQVGVDLFARAGHQSARARLDHLRVRFDRDPQFGELVPRGIGKFFGQRRKNARPAFEQGDVEPAFVEHLKPICRSAPAAL